MSFAKVSSAILLILAVVSLVNAQTTTGSIFGDVTDASGAVLSGVAVRVASPSTGTYRSNAQGPGM